jgi:threonine-phosphate decarboxylase
LTLPHGGNVYHYSKKYNIPVDGFLDFSASINPLGPSRAAVRAMKDAIPSLVNYPDPESGVLKDALSSRHGIRRESILIGNGSTELIYLLARAVRPGKALLPAPAFSDYERAVRLAGSMVSRLTLKEKDGFVPDMDRLRKALDGVDLLFLCNPNNPTGVLLDRDTVQDAVRMARRAGAFTVVDEAFMEYSPGGSVIADAAGGRGVAVLRNFTKFHGLPGLRAGYLVAHPSAVEKLAAFKEPWSVNTLAERAGAAALTDEAHARRSLRLMEKEKAFLYRGLGMVPGLRPYPPSANFVLVKLTGSGLVPSGLAEDLASRGILVRDCSNFRGLDGPFIRVAVRTRRENEALLGALKRSVCFTPH